MKIKNLFYVSLAALSLAACSKDDAPAPEAGVSFKLATVEAVTKADSESPTVSGEATINNATIYIYKVGADNSTTLQTSQDITSGSATINLPQGTYKAAAVVNTSGISSTVITSSLADLKASVIALSDNGKTSFVMYGDAGSDVVVSNDGTAIGSGQTITVKRIVAGLQIGELTFKLPKDVEAAYQTAVTNDNVKIVSFKIKSSLTSAVLSTGAISGTTSGYVADLMNASFDNTSSMSDGVLTTTNATSAERVYSYALATTPELQLCLQFGSQPVSYYNLSLDKKTFNVNTMYTLNAEITGTGSSTETGKDAITTYSLKVQNWETGEVLEGGTVGN